MENEYGYRLRVKRNYDDALAVRYDIRLSIRRICNSGRLDNAVKCDEAVLEHNELVEILTECLENRDMAIDGLNAAMRGKTLDVLLGGDQPTRLKHRLGIAAALFQGPCTEGKKRRLVTKVRL